MGEVAAVIGLVASIAQLIEVGAKIVTRVNEFASATTEVPKSFLILRDRVALLTITLQEVQRQVSGGLVGDAAAKVLRPIVERSLTNTQKLIIHIEKAVPKTTSSRLGKLARALKSLAYDSKVQKIVTQLEKDIQAFIFNQTTSQTDAVEQIRQDLSRLNVASNAPSLSYSLGLCLGEAPQIDASSFVGRETELAQLCEWLTPRLSPPSQNVVALSGMGGLGKTQLSLAFARQYQVMYSSVLWLNAKDERALRHDIVTLSRRLFPNPSQVLGPSSDQQEEEQAVHQVRQWLSADDNGRWLVLLDNYDHPKIPGVKSETGFDIRRYFPYRSQGSILITTRSTRLTFAKSLKLQKLESVEEAVAILSERSGRNLGQNTSAIQLAKRLEGLPLALATAGTYLRQTAVGPDEYLVLYDQYWQVLCEDAEELVEYENRTLFSTWTLSLTQVRAQDANAAELLRLLAYFDNKDIWYELLQSGEDHTLPWLSEVTRSKVRFDSTMRRLHDYSLVEVSTAGYSLHTCIHDWTLQALNKEVSAEHYWTALDCVASSVIHESEREYWEVTRRLLGHALRLEHPRFSAVAIEEQLDESRCYYLHSLGELYRNHSNMTKAEQKYQRALAGYEKILGPDHISTLDTVNNLGMLYDVQGKMTEAEQMYQRALAGTEQALGPDHISTLSTVNNLGVLYGVQGKMTEAEQMYQRALAGREQALGPDHISTLDTVNNLGMLYRGQGKIAEAEQMYQRALAGTEQALGPDHISTLDTVNNLGVLYDVQGKMTEAEQMYQRALAGREQALGPDHISTLQTVDNLGGLYHIQGKMTEAEQMYQRALAGKEQALGPDHISTLQTVDNLGGLYRIQGKMTEAEQMYQRALAGKERALGPDHISTLETVSNLGLLYADLGKMVEAEQMLQRALAGFESQLGPHHRLTIQTLKTLQYLSEQSNFKGHGSPQHPP